MVSTITTATVSSISVPGLAASLAVIGAVLLVALLVQKELTLPLTAGRFQKFGSIVNIGIIPLFFAFAIGVALKLLQVLS